MEIILEEPFRSLYRKGYLRTEKDGRKYVSLYNKPGIKDRFPMRVIYTASNLDMRYLLK